MIVLGQGRLVFICPECKFAMSMDVERRTYLTGGFNCECGTQVTFTLDSRRSQAMERLARLRADWRKLRSEGRADGDTSAKT